MHAWVWAGVAGDDGEAGTAGRNSTGRWHGRARPTRPPHAPQMTIDRCSLPSAMVPAGGAGKPPRDPIRSAARAARRLSARARMDSWRLAQADAWPRHMPPRRRVGPPRRREQQLMCRPRHRAAPAARPAAQPPGRCPSRGRPGAPSGGPREGPGGPSSTQRTWRVFGGEVKVRAVRLQHVQLSAKKGAQALRVGSSGQQNSPLLALKPKAPPESRPRESPRAHRQAPSLRSRNRTEGPRLAEAGGRRGPGCPRLLVALGARGAPGRHQPLRTA